MTNKKVKYLIPIPKIEEGHKFLIVQPHPDDADIYAGGFAASMIEKGKEVVYVTVTDGAMGTTDRTLKPVELATIRRSEAETSAKTLGVNRLIFLGYPDADAITHKELRRDFIGLIRQEKPDGILLPDPWLPYEAHTGHVIVGLAGAEAALFSPLPHFEPKGEPHELKLVAFYTSHKPNTFVDITPFWEKKLKAISMHKSQFSPDLFKLFSIYLEVMSREWGEDGGFEKAEAFKVLTLYHLHGNVDTWEL